MTEKGGAWLPSTFGHEFAKQLDRAGLPHLSFHGLRHLAATALADAGCSDRDIMAITGHRTASMVARYTAKADQRVRASAAILKLERRG
jgi:integrase